MSPNSKIPPSRFRASRALCTASLMSAGAAEVVGSTSSRHVWQQSLYGMEAMRAGIRTATQLAVGGEYQSLVTTNQSQPDEQRQRGVVSPPHISHLQPPRSQISRTCACAGCEPAIARRPYCTGTVTVCNHIKIPTPGVKDKCTGYAFIVMNRAM